VRVDLNGLTRAISLLEKGDVKGETVVSLLSRERDVLEQQTYALFSYAEQTTVELRRIREAKEPHLLEQVEGARTIQDGNDQFVAQLIAEHEAVVMALRRERDAALARVRELSKGLSRIGGLSTPNLRHVSASNLSVATPNDSEVAVLRARVDELLLERERSLKLLRQLAEQRDQAESRLQALLVSVAPETERPLPSGRPTELGSAVEDRVRDAETRNDHGHLAPTSPSSPQPVFTPRTEPLDNDSTTDTSSAVIRNAAPLPESTETSEPNVDSGWELPVSEELPATSTTEPISTDNDVRSDEEEPSSPSLRSAVALPLLRRKPAATDESAGTYRISASELPVEEVVLLHDRPSHPRPNR
jgi:hypothetical protein